MTESLRAGARTSDGQPIPVIVPSRYYAYAPLPDGTRIRRFPLSAMADFISDIGFDGIDVSMEDIASLDDAWQSVYYSLASRAAARGLCLPVCHLPFYMPSPDDAPAMARFVREQEKGLRAAALMQIPLAVIHPIVRHSSACKYADWYCENLRTLSPLRELAGALNVTLCIENMTGTPYRASPDETVYGSRAQDIRRLADQLDTGICWDFGHANLTGLSQSESLREVGRYLRIVHIHDNDGRHDLHRIPGSGSVDWDDAMQGLRMAGYTGATGRCLDLELKSSDLPADRATRSAHAARALSAAKWLAAKL